MQIEFRSRSAAVFHRRCRRFTSGGDAQLLSEVLTGNTRPLLRVLWIAVSVVLLIACANVAILMLVRAVRYHQEYAVRLALGARSTSIFRDTVLEGLLLSLSGGLLGLVFAGVAIRIASHSLSESIPRIGSISINVPVTLFTLGIAITVGVLCSLVPAFVALRTKLIAGLKDTASTTTGAASHARLHLQYFVVTEIGVALVLFIASLLFVRSYQEVLSADLGFEPQHVLVVGYRLPQEQYPTDASVEKFNLGSDRAVVEETQCYLL